MFIGCTVEKRKHAKCLGHAFPILCGVGSTYLQTKCYLLLLQYQVESVQILQSTANIVSHLSNCGGKDGEMGYRVG